MPDLLQSAQMFEVSSKAQRAGAYLQELARGQDPGERGWQTLAWVGDLLPQVDWGYSGKRKEQAANAMLSEATCARPAFYASLVKLRDRFKDAGMECEEEVARFLGALYDLLASRGLDTDPPNALKADRLELASRFLSELAHAILRQYGSRMPERPSLLGY